MIQIRIHGRGGQGVVAMAEILAIAFFNNGQNAQAFPHFGVERSGAPIQSFVRVSQQKIFSREHVYEPDILIILDDSLLGKADLFSGIKAHTKVIINSKEAAKDLLNKFKKISKIPSGFSEKNIFAKDATSLALEIFAKNMVNTAMLGFLCQVPGLIKKEAAISAVKEKFANKGADIIEKNILIINRI